MKKIGIITINDNNNYGNRLQNYALQETLKKLGYEVETIKNNRYFNSKVGIKTQMAYIKRNIKSILHNLFFESPERKIKFRQFNKYVKFSKKNISAYNSNSSNNYDYFVVGSDQVWKPTGQRLSDVTLLKFAKDQQKISYAASFGVGEINSKVELERKNDFIKFKAISVREDQGKEIVEKMTGRKDIEVLIDPTLLLDTTEWDKVIFEPKHICKMKEKKYILKYFLGDLSQERKSEIDRIATENECEIIDILDKNSPFYKTGPSEFLYLEKNAFLVCTDSFHSCVFAFLFDVPFIVFEREGASINMNSRIETLISKFNLSDRLYSGRIMKKNINHDYTEAYKKLNLERQKSCNYLTNNLK